MTVYLDHNATCPLDPEVLEAMQPYLRDRFGNPSSIHSFGQAARRGLDVAREQVASLIGADPEEIVFTSGGTEADNLAILGGHAALCAAGRRVAVSPIEHQAVLGPAAHLSSLGAEVVYLSATADGVIDLDSVASALDAGAGLISVMTANNDTGVVQPVAAVAEKVRAAGALLHTDAVQAAGKIPLDVSALGAHLLAFSGHKIYGPKGIGALYVRRGTRITPTLFGGHQEDRRRAGTENVAAIVGFGRACALAAARMAGDAARLSSLRDRLEAGILSAAPDAVVFGKKAERIPNTTNIGFPSLEGDTLVMALDLQGVGVSTGSACQSEHRDPSHVLTAMGAALRLARGSIRFSLGRHNTAAEVDEVVALLKDLVPRLRIP